MLQQAMELHKQGRTKEAAALYHQLLEQQPDQPEALYYLGVIEYGQKQFADAAKRLRRSYALRPRSEVGYNLSRILSAMGEEAEAIAVLQKLLADEPAHFNAAFDLGLLLRNAERQDEAVSAFASALESPVHAVAAMSNMGLCHQDMGDLEQARHWFGRAAEAQPQKGLAWRQLASVTRFTDPADARITMMEQQKATAEKEEDRQHLAFALGKAYDDLGDYARAFACYAEGNRIKRKEYAGFSVEQAQQAFEGMAAFFTPTRFSMLPASQVAGSERMIFVLGMPRSGSTLVEQILASHPEVYGAGEVDFLHRALATLGGRNFDSLSAADMDALGRHYLESVHRSVPSDAPRIIDKNLLNTRYAPLIARMLPQAKIIHCKRNAADNCISIFRQSFVGNYPYAYSLEETAAYYRMQERLVERYKKLLTASVFREVVYEELVEDMEAESRKLLDFCGLEWSAECLSFHATRRAVKTASAAQVRQPLFRTSLGMAERYGEALAPMRRMLEEQE